MTLFDDESEIWIVKPTEEDLQAGAEYAAISLPWVFNRMGKDKSSKGQQQRAFNIAKGIVGQRVLQSELARRGIDAEIEVKSHRNKDLFDFRVSIGGAVQRLDVKTMTHYNDYPNDEREPFTPALVAAHRGYPGPDWRTYFPMLVPHTQIKQDKQAYCFAIGSSVDFRRSIDKNRSGFALTAFPHKGLLTFFSGKALCAAREKAGKGIFLNCSYVPCGLWDRPQVEMTIVGEWDGKLMRKSVSLMPDTPVSGIGPFSCVTSFQMARAEHEGLGEGQIEISICQNDLDQPVRNSSKRDVNVVPEEALTVRRNDFANLYLPDDYTLFFVGWITKQNFLARCRHYPAWIWPMDKVNRHENRPWSRITEKDRKALESTGFEDCIQSSPACLAAGWMKGMPNRGSSCCYVYPNVYGGGLQETNLYVLPRDLMVMRELGQ